MSPVITQVRAVVQVIDVPATSPIIGVTEYELMADVPIDEGASQLTVALRLPATAVTPVGAPGAAGTKGLAQLGAVPAACPDEKLLML